MVTSKNASLIPLLAVIELSGSEIELVRERRANLLLIWNGTSGPTDTSEFGLCGHDFGNPFITEFVTSKRR